MTGYNFWPYKIKHILGLAIVHLKFLNVAWLKVLVYFISLAWVFICFTRSLLCEKALANSLHLYSYIPIWVVICVFSFLFTLKVLSHWLHLYGFSPVWVSICLIRCCFFEKYLLHREHLCGFFSSVFHYVQYKFALYRKSLNTLTAPIRFISCVNSHMSF